MSLEQRVDVACHSKEYDDQNNVHAEVAARPYTRHDTLQLLIVSLHRLGRRVHLQSDRWSSSCDQILEHFKLSEAFEHS